MITRHKNGKIRKPGYKVFRLTPSFKIREGKVTSYYRFWDLEPDATRPYFNGTMVTVGSLFSTFEEARAAGIEQLTTQRNKLQVRLVKVQSRIAAISNELPEAKL